MAVSITTEDLKQPAGELSDAYFPQGDLDAHLSGWLTAATAAIEGDSAIDVANHDRAAVAWVYWRAYDYIANQLAAMPSSLREGDGTLDVSYAVTQFRYYRDRANEKKAEFDALRGGKASMGVHFSLACGRRGVW